MAKYQNKYRIESNRWRYWDYSAPASYFITICIVGRKCILGYVNQRKMILSDYGKIVETEFPKIPEYNQRAMLDVWQIMPNHIHCIITLGNYDFDNGVSVIGGGNHGVVGDNVEKIHEFSLSDAPPPEPPPEPPESPPPPNPWWYNPQYKPTITEIKQYRKYRRNMVIPKLTGKFQTLTSKQINILRKTPGVKNWQHDYHDHVIRSDAEYQRIKNYIINNPKNWDEDIFYK